MKKIICTFLIMCVVISSLYGCGSVNSTAKTDDSEGIDSIIDVYFGSKNDNIKEYVKDMIQTDVGNVKLYDFEFNIDELIYDRYSGFGFYRITITSQETDMNSFVTPDAIYLLQNDEYRIEVFEDGAYWTVVDRGEDNGGRIKKVINKNKMVVYGMYTDPCINIENIEDKLEIWVLNDNIEEKEKGVINLPHLSNSVEIKVNEDLDCWLSAFGMKEYYHEGKNPIDSAQEVFVGFKDGYKEIIKTANYPRGGLVTSNSAKDAVRMNDFGEIVNIDDIEYLSIDGKIYQVNNTEE